MASGTITRRALLRASAAGLVATTGCLGSASRRGVTPSVSESERTERRTSVYETVVIFRNDDPAPWAAVDTLAAVNEPFVDADVPLTLGVVPYDRSEEEQLDRDHDVCQSLRSLTTRDTALFEPALHGYSHARKTDFYWGSEFGGLAYEAQKKRLQKALQKFGDCFETRPTSFVPPFNTYDENTVRVLSEMGFEIVSGGSYFQREHFGERGFWKHGGIMHLPANLAMEDADTQEVRDIAALKAEYRQNRERHGLNVIMFHYDRYADESDRQTLNEMVRYASEDDSKIMTLSEFARRERNGGLRRTADGWAVRESPSSSTAGG